MYSISIGIDIGIGISLVVNILPSSLTRFTRYQYQLVVRNDFGFASGEIVTAVTMAGIPLQSPSLFASAVNHTALQANWTPPCESATD